MPNLRQLKEELLANGRVEGHEIERLRQELYGNGRIDQRKADFLVELHKQIERVTPAFEKFFYKALKDYILIDGAIKAKETAWLRQMLDGQTKIDDNTKRFLTELKGEAREVSPEFEKLLKERLQ